MSTDKPPIVDHAAAPWFRNDEDRSMHKDQEAFRDAGRRSCQEMVAAINAVDRRSAIAHQRLAAMHAERAASLIAAG